MLPIIYKLKNLPVLKILDEIQKTQYYSSDQLEEFQYNKIKLILNHSYNYSKYYNNIFKNINLNPNNINSINDLSKIPITNKNDFIENSKNIYTQTKNISSWKTSGTSGKETICLKNSMDRAYFYAFKHRFNSWHNIGIKDEEILLWRRTNEFSNQSIKRIREIIKDRFLNIKRISPVKLDKDLIENILFYLTKKHGKYLRGYTTSITDIAQHMIKNEIKLNSEYLKVIIPTGEVLYDHQREFITKAFNTTIANEYGASECGLIATECEEGKLHINDDNVFIEIVDDYGKPTKDIGRIIITSLNTFATPCIRYDIGDRGKISHSKCNCGKNLSILDTIEGRTFDYIILPSGKRVIIVGIFMFGVMKNMPSNINDITKFQIEQKSRHKLIFRLISKSRNDKIKSFIIKKLNKYLDDSVEIEINFVNSIPSKGNKYKHLIKYT